MTSLFHPQLFLPNSSLEQISSHELKTLPSIKNSPLTEPSGSCLRTTDLGPSISLKFSLKTRLEHKSFEPLIDFLAFLVQKFASKKKQIN